MANAYQVKLDVVNELRNRLYYNQLEIQRLLNNPPNMSHKEIVDTVLLYLNLNVEAEASIDLMERYIPTPQPQKPEAEQSVQDNGIKKID